MTIVQSVGQLEALPSPFVAGPIYGAGSIGLYNDLFSDYGELYTTQSNVHTVVDFLARNVAELGLHVYRRVSDTDRLRLNDHPLAQLVKQPNPSTTAYRLLESLVKDVATYGNAFLVKVQPRRAPMLVLRADPRMVSVYGSLVPTAYEVGFNTAQPLKLDPEQMVHFRLHNPNSQISGLSPLEPLRRVLAEEAASGDYRENFWKNAARMSGIIERPLGAPEWSDPAMQRFRAQFKAMYSGASNSGETAVLEEGMTYKPMTFSARESEYLSARKLTREEVARAYHVPPPMVGILDHATFSNITEQHKNLYQDCLGPWLAMIEQEIELQLLSDFTDTDRVYVEFNIAAKLKSSFEEQATTLSSAVGRPWLTADEARARQNLPSLGGDAAELVTPLNVLVGGQASPVDSAPPKALPAPETKRAINSTYLTLREKHVAAWDRALGDFFQRQMTATVPKAKGFKAAFRAEDWNDRLRQRLLALNLETAGMFGGRVADALGIDDWNPDEMEPFFRENSRIAAEGINKTTAEQIAKAQDSDDPPSAIRRVFEILVGVRAAQIAQSKVTTAANFGAHRAAERGGASFKTWSVNSGNPRSQHAAVSGETVKMSENFSNGLRWPGDSQAGDAAQLSNCQCSVEFSVRSR